MTNPTRVSRVHLLCASTTVFLALASAGCGGAEDSAEAESKSSDDAVTVALSGRIQAEAFNTGGEGVGYHDTTAANIGGAYRTSEAVDVEASSGGGYHVGWTAPNEWLAYAVSAPTAGRYTFSVRVASGRTGTKSLHLEIDGTALGAASFTDEAGWQVFRTVAAGSRTLTAGTHTLRLVSETGRFNVDYIDVTAPASYPLRFGVSATAPDSTNLPSGTSTYSQEVDRQVQTLGAQAFFDYFQEGEAPHWSGEGTAYPATADVVASTKVADTSAVASYVASIPARSGKVYLHYWQEPEDEVMKTGTFTLQQFRDRTVAVHAAIPAGNSTVIPSVHLQEYWLFTRGADFEAGFITPSTRHVSWSLYGANTDPVASVQRIEAFMTSRFPTLSWGIGAAGYALATVHTAAEGKARADWLTANVNAVKATSSRHYMWFDTNWPQGAGDFRIANDSVLLSTWRSVSGM